mgnify:FL=1
MIKVVEKELRHPRKAKNIDLEKIQIERMKKLEEIFDEVV